jgi:glutathione synthase
MNFSQKEILIIADAFHTLDFKIDSTLYLCKVAILHYQCKVHWCTPDDIYLHNNLLFVQTSGEIEKANDDTKMLNPNKSVFRPLHSFYKIFYRKDPPVTESLMRFFQLLSRFEELHHLMINSPLGMLNLNEKLLPLYFLEYSIESYFINNKNFLNNIIKEISASAIILKPMSAMASLGVSFFSSPFNLEEIKAHFEKIQKLYGEWVMLQPFDESIHSVGETRIFMIDDKIVGSYLKTIPKHIKIANIDETDESRKPTLQICEPTQIQKERAKLISETMKHYGIRFYAIDFIGDKILEINFTSIGMIKWHDENAKIKNQIAMQFFDYFLK